MTTTEIELRSWINLTEGIDLREMAGMEETTGMTGGRVIIIRNQIQEALIFVGMEDVINGTEISVIAEMEAEETTVTQETLEQIQEAHPIANLSNLRSHSEKIQDQSEKKEKKPTHAKHKKETKSQAGSTTQEMDPETDQESQENQGTHLLKIPHTKNNPTAKGEIMTTEIRPDSHMISTEINPETRGSRENNQEMAGTMLQDSSRDHKRVGIKEIKEISDHVMVGEMEMIQEKEG